jgi:hypothetical protein
MLRDTVEESSVEVESAPTWAGGTQSASGLDWRMVDRTLRAIARAAVDAAIAAHGEDLPLARLVIESLRRCPVRKL